MKRKLDESGIDNGSTSIKRGCYFQCITSVLFRRENRINAFARMKQCVEPAVKAQIQQQSICINCQQLTKKENQKVSPGKLCNWCEKFVCFNCVQQCSKCEFDFCQFCSIQLYDDKDSCKCLSCK